MTPTLLLAQPAPPPPPPAYEGSAEFAFVSTTGNASTQTLGAGGQLIARPDAWTLRARATYVQNEAEDVLTATGTRSKAVSPGRPSSRIATRCGSMRASGTRASHD